MSKEDILKKAVDSILKQNEKGAVEAAQEALKEGISPLEVIEEGFTVGIRKVGDLFDRGKLFLPHVMLSADAMKKGIEVLEPYIEKGGEKAKLGTVVIGTVEGDIHEIGKGIVAIMLQVAGFEVHDLGRDVPLKKFIEMAKKTDADLVGSSALMTTSITGQKTLEKMLKDAGLRSNLRTIVGGAPATEIWAKKIGADAYAENATEAVQKAKELIIRDNA
jgi:trimethylamine corrinoid protein